MGIKLTVRFRPNFGHCTETNTVIAVAAAFRRPSPLSERLQLGGMRTPASASDLMASRHGQASYPGR